MNNAETAKKYRELLERAESILTVGGEMDRVQMAAIIRRELSPVQHTGKHLCGESYSPRHPADCYYCRIAK